jgi:hypothetical protein
LRGGILLTAKRAEGTEEGLNLLTANTLKHAKDSSFDLRSSRFARDMTESGPQRQVD